MSGLTVRINNTPALRQLNAAGTAYLGIKINASNQWEIGASIIPAATNLLLGTATLYWDYLYADRIRGGTATANLGTLNTDDSAFILYARDNGSALVEIARMVSAADPYLQATLAFRLLPIATASLPGTPVEGMIAYDDTANKLKVYNGAAWETVTSA